VIAAAIPTAAGAAAAGALALGIYYPNSWLFGRVTGRGSRAGTTAYLTFDDGPNPTATDRILETLAAHGVPAAFFMVGAHVQRHPDIARRVATAGHEIGNHTQHHIKLHVRGPRRIRRELEEAHRAISGLAGAAPRVFRAPHGYRNPFVAPVTQRLGYRVFGWTFGVWDSARPGAEEIRRRVRTHLRPGAIILLHDGDGYDPAGDRSQTAAALPGIIQDARDAGYSLRPLGDLLP
jgi:peptidoglycan/xylan/chitin deacetylase (PgdA/CDA1 family)